MHSDLLLRCCQATNIPGREPQSSRRFLRELDVYRQDLVGRLAIRTNTSTVRFVGYFVFILGGGILLGFPFRARACFRAFRYLVRVRVFVGRLRNLALRGRCSTFGRHCCSAPHREQRKRVRWTSRTGKVRMDAEETQWRHVACTFAVTRELARRRLPRSGWTSPLLSLPRRLHVPVQKIAYRRLHRILMYGFDCIAQPSLTVCTSQSSLQSRETPLSCFCFVLSTLSHLSVPSNLLCLRSHLYQQRKTFSHTRYTQITNLDTSSRHVDLQRLLCLD